MKISEKINRMADQHYMQAYGNIDREDTRWTTHRIIAKNEYWRNQVKYKGFGALFAVYIGFNTLNLSNARLFDEKNIEGEKLYQQHETLESSLNILESSKTAYLTPHDTLLFKQEVLPYLNSYTENLESEKLTIEENPDYQEYSVQKENKDDFWKKFMLSTLGGTFLALLLTNQMLNRSGNVLSARLELISEDMISSLRNQFNSTEGSQNGQL